MHTTSVNYEIWILERMAGSATEPFRFTGPSRDDIRFLSGWMADLRGWPWCGEVRWSPERKRCGIWRSFLWFVDTGDAGLGRWWLMRFGGGFRDGGRFA